MKHLQGILLAKKIDYSHLIIKMDSLEFLKCITTMTPF
jgi:hypothetical protein